MARRFSRFLRNTDGFPGMLSVARAFLGLGGELDAVAARYRTLSECAPGTFGRALVLSGYGTHPQGEIQQAAFQAGFARRDGFTFLLFGILQFHVGMRITPIAQGFEGLFDVPAVLEALRRGAACRVDLSDGFDVFERKDRPLDEVRHELGID